LFFELPQAVESYRQMQMKDPRLLDSEPLRPERAKSIQKWLALEKWKMYSY
jgi:hypothetical protein